MYCSSNEGKAHLHLSPRSAHFSEAHSPFLTTSSDFLSAPCSRRPPHRRDCCRARRFVAACKHGRLWDHATGAKRSWDYDDGVQAMVRLQPGDGICDGLHTLSASARANGRGAFPAPVATAPAPTPLLRRHRRHHRRRPLLRLPALSSTLAANAAAEDATALAAADAAAYVPTSPPSTAAAALMPPCVSDKGQCDNTCGSYLGPVQAGVQDERAEKRACKLGCKAVRNDCMASCVACTFSQ